VLAGGRSTRFGSDKLAVPHRGRPLLHHAVAAVAACCEHVLIVAAPGRDPADPALDMGTLPRPVRGRVRVISDPVEGGGPLIGLRAGLEATTTGVALVVGGDMPGLSPEVLRDLLERLSIGNASAVALDDGTHVRPLPAAVRTEPALAAARRLLDAGERSLRALLRTLDVVGVGKETWTAIDPEGGTLRDVDEVGDLSDGER